MLGRSGSDLSSYRLGSLKCRVASSGYSVSRSDLVKLVAGSAPG